MGLLDQVKDMFDGEDGASQKGLLDSATNLLGGGMKDLREKFESSGLGDTFKSWTESGDNKEVTAEDMKKVFGEDKLKELADKQGLDADSLVEKLRGFFPKLIDQVTPDGKGDDSVDILGSVKGLLNKIPGL